MKKYFIIAMGLAALLCLSPKANAAITFDASSTWTTGSSVASITWNHTVTSTANNMLFILGLTTNNDASATYNGVSMTKEVVLAVDSSRFLSLFALPSASTGTHAVVLAGAGSEAVIQGGGVSYAGVLQSTILDATTTTATSTNVFNVSTTLTTLANGDWSFLGARAANGNWSAGASSTVRVLSGTSLVGMFDTNVPKSPAGSQLMGVTDAGGSNGAYTIMVAFAPAPSGVSINSTADVSITNATTMRGITIQ